MATELVKAQGSAIERLSFDAFEYFKAHLSDNTRRCYASAWKRFLCWCRLHCLDPLGCEPQHVALYATELAKSGRKVATVELAMAAIAKAWTLSGQQSPLHAQALKLVLQGIRRKHGKPPEQVAALTPSYLRETINAFPSSPLWTLRNARNRAILTLGFAGAFRRSELVGLDVDDLSFGDEGVKVLIKKSKTDQEGKGRFIGIPYGSVLETCPVRSLLAWVEKLHRASGPLFVSTSQNGALTCNRLSGQAVARMISTATKRAGFIYRFSGHSLRSGLVTAAVKAGKSIASIQAQTGHTSVNVLVQYARNESLFDDNAAAGIGL